MKKKGISQILGIPAGVLVALLLVFVNAPQSVAQTVTGTILGTIRDQQGAVFPNASVSAKNLETGAERTAITGASGGYSIVSVPAGAYEVTASAQGFRTGVRSGLTLTVGASLRVDFTLNLGAVAERVEVTGEAPLVDTTTSTMRGLVAEGVIRELPLNGRDWLQLALLQPGVASVLNVSTIASRGLGVRMSISGGRTSANVYRVDGLVVNDHTNNSPGSVMGGNMGVDAIREFSVLTNTFSAEYGRSSGGVINAITKSGTNDFHGTTFYFHRNSVLDARNFFDKGEVPPFRRHQFGASLGGPVKQDKLFFFSNYEALREFLSLSLVANTLSPNARNGILTCPTRSPLPADLPADCTAGPTYTVVIDPRVRPYLNLYPEANGPIAGDVGQFLKGMGKISNDDYVIGKMDYQLSANTTLAGSYTFDNASDGRPDVFATQIQDNRTRSQRVLLSLQHVFSPTVLNTVRAGLNRFVGLGVGQALNPLLTDLSLGFVPSQAVGAFRVSELDNLEGLDISRPNSHWYTDPQLNDDLAWVKGRHNLRMGFNVEAMRSNQVVPPILAGRWSFGSVRDFLTVTNPVSFQVSLPGSSGYSALRSKIFGGYVQDDFRLSPQLTLNLGLRYEPATAISDVDGRIALIKNLSDPKPTFRSKIYRNPTLRNFAPRLGFAWDPFGSGRTAVRGGFGIFDVLPLPNLFVQRLSSMYPFRIDGQVASPNLPAASFPARAWNLIGGGDLKTTLVQFTPDRAYKMQWNLNFQREIAGGWSVTAGYVGARAVHLTNNSTNTNVVPPHLLTVARDGHLMFPDTRPIPPATRPSPVPVLNPNWSVITLVAWNGYSNYHGLQVNVAKQMSRGFTVQGAYAWSKSMDIGSAEIATTDTTNTVDYPYAPFPHLNRGRSDFDFPHRLSVNFLWEAPSLRSGMVLPRFLLSGWQLSGIFQAQSGYPANIIFSQDRAGTGSVGGGGPAGGSNQRPDFKPGPGCSSPNAINPGNPDVYVRLECFAYPAINTLGNLGRNALRGPGLENFDFSLFKNHNLLGENLKAQFRAEFFNLFNRANFGMQRVIGFNTQGLPVAANAALKTTVTKPRLIQFGMKLIW